MSFMYVLLMEDNCISTLIQEMDIGNFLQFEYSEIIRWNQNNVLNKAKKKLSIIDFFMFIKKVMRKISQQNNNKNDLN